VLASGRARSRNFPANRYPFRAESHFLYFVGMQLEGAVLWLSPETERLYVPRPDPADALWHGRGLELEQLAELLRIPVAPSDELARDAGLATLPPNDEQTAVRLSALTGRPIAAGSGTELSGSDQALAEWIIELRLQHDAAAIEQLRQASVVTGMAHVAGMKATTPGVPEARIRAAMEAAITAAGMTPAYSSIVTSHGEVLHNERYDHILSEDDLLLADVGAETPEGWASDVTRTWPVSGEFSTTQRELYEVVLAAQRAAIGLVRPGVRYREIHRAAARELLAGLVTLGICRGDLDELLERGVAALFFPHGVGHLLGLDVHDMEDLGDRAGYAPDRARSQAPGERYLRLDRDLLPGMAVTIEPGFYRIPALLAEGARGDLRDAVAWDVLERYADTRGIRIEDDVLVTDTGAELLTAQVPKTVAEIEAVLQGGPGPTSA
jgi:Xaa-Pro aminopeptidase